MAAASVESGRTSLPTWRKDVENNGDLGVTELCQAVDMATNLTPTVWADDGGIDVERLKELVPQEGGETITHYPYSRGHCGMCKYIVEPIALHLARHDDWLDLQDVTELTGYRLTARVAVLELVSQLHPEHPDVRADGHRARRVAAQQALHGQILERVTAAVARGGEVDAGLLGYVEHWPATYPEEQELLAELSSAHRDVLRGIEALAQARRRRHAAADALSWRGWFDSQIGMQIDLSEGEVRDILQNGPLDVGGAKQPSGHSAGVKTGITGSFTSTRPTGGAGDREELVERARQLGIGSPEELSNGQLAESIAAEKAAASWLRRFEALPDDKSRAAAAVNFAATVDQFREAR